MQPKSKAIITEQIGRLSALAHWINIETYAVNDCWCEGPVLYEREAAIKLEQVQHQLEKIKDELDEAVKFLRKEIEAEAM